MVRNLLTGITLLAIVVLLAPFSQPARAGGKGNLLVLNDSISTAAVFVTNEPIAESEYAALKKYYQHPDAVTPSNIPANLVKAHPGCKWASLSASAGQEFEFVSTCHGVVWVPLRDPAKGMLAGDQFLPFTLSSPKNTVVIENNPKSDTPSLAGHVKVRMERQVR